MPRRSCSQVDAFTPEEERFLAKSAKDAKEEQEET